MEVNIVQQVEQAIMHHGNTREALVEVLRDLSRDCGCLSREILAVVADRLKMPPSQVFSVASFYSMINLESQGKHVIKFCQDAPCHVVGGREVWEALEHELGIPFGETTSDGQWSLLTTSCIGACAVGPVMMLDDEIYGNLTPEKVRQILAQYNEAATGGEA